MTIKKMAHSHRPREKLLRQGLYALSDLELLAIILGSGQKNNDVLKVAKKVKKKINSTPFSKLIKNTNFQKNEKLITEISQIPGIANVQASKIIASLELGRRYFYENKLSKLDSPEKVFQHCFEIRHKKQEYCLALYLNGKQELIDKKILSIGGFNYNFLEARDIFEKAFELKASFFILAHNHPSGNLVASDQDLILTEKVIKVARIMGVKLMDHLIICKDNYYSIRENYEDIFNT